MKSTSALSVVVCFSVFVLSFLCLHSNVHAVGVLYADPGWTFSYDGDEAFYNDPDGYNPDYSGQDPNNNQPGSRGGLPILVDPTVDDPNCDPQSEGSCGTAAWLAKSSQWEGSAPGDVLGGVPTGTPPLAPPAPGGVQTYDESGTSYLRIQDPGEPSGYGWVDKGVQGGPGGARQEGNNRKIQFHHPLDHDDPNVDPAVLDNGITISFRARIATAATGPLDDIFPEGGTTLGDSEAWPTDGIGSGVYNDGRGMFHIAQSGGPGGLQQMSFSLLNYNAIDINVAEDPNFDPNSTLFKTGLVMNNQANSAVSDDVDTNMALLPTDPNDPSTGTLNIVEIPNEDLDDWHEFWITIEALPTPVDDNTHEVNVYLDGEVDTPQTFQIVLAQEHEFDFGAHLAIGQSSGSAAGAHDIDFVAYSLGVLAPTPGCGDGDFDCNGIVDGKDFLLWQQGGSPDPLSAGDLALWESNYGNGGALSAATAAVPEPSGFVLAMSAVAWFWGRKRSV